MTTVEAVCTCGHPLHKHEWLFGQAPTLGQCFHRAWREDDDCHCPAFTARPTAAEIGRAERVAAGVVASDPDEYARDLEADRRRRDALAATAATVERRHLLVDGRCITCEVERHRCWCGHPRHEHGEARACQHAKYTDDACPCERYELADSADDLLENLLDLVNDLVDDLDAVAARLWADDAAADLICRARRYLNFTERTPS